MLLFKSDRIKEKWCPYYKIKKNVLAVFMATSVLALSGCAWTDPTRPIETPAPAQTHSLQLLNQ